MGNKRNFPTPFKYCQRINRRVEFVCAERTLGRNKPRIPMSLHTPCTPPPPAYQLRRSQASCAPVHALMICPPLSSKIFPSNTGLKARHFPILEAISWDTTNSSVIETGQPSRTEEMHEEKFDSEEILLSEKKLPDGFISKIVFSTGKKITIDDVNQLYDKVDWVRNSPNVIASSLKNSYMIATLHLIIESPTSANSQNKEILIGMARAASDHAFNAIIWDVMVDPLYQRHGLGKALLQKMVFSLQKRGINVITLFSVSEAIGFYKKVGFEEPTDMKGMCWNPKC